MLLFYCTFEKSLQSIAEEGLTTEGESFVMHRTLEAAEAACGSSNSRRGRVLVLDPSRVGYAQIHPPKAHHIAPHAILNVKPYRKPLAIDAAGGYVLRRSAKGKLKVLAIFRRGMWDLPKGKLESGETLEECAIREVSEEIGIKKKSLKLLQPLGVSLHGFVLPRKRRFAVKTTHWYAMETTQKKFTPQASEGIKAVTWMSWKKAKVELGYESLRRHMAAIDPEALGLAPVESANS